MRDLKQIFFAVAAVVSLGLFAASDAHAKLSCTTSSSPTLVRSEGTIEVVGKVDLVCTTDATGAAATSITFTLSPGTATIAPTASGGPACGAGGNNTSTFPNVLVTSTVAFAAGPTCSVSGNQANFSFTPADAAQTISLSGARVNIAASGLTAGAAVSASLTVSPTGPLQLTITNPTLIVAFAFASTFSTNTLSIASCGPSIATPIGSPSTVAGNPDAHPLAANSLKVTITEGFATALQAAATEDGGSAFGQGTRIRIQLSGIPSGFVIYTPRTITSLTDGTLATTGAVSPDAAGALTLQRVGTSGTPVNADGSGGAINGIVLNQFDRISVSSGVATIVYEVTVAAATPVVNTVTIFVAITGTATTGTGTISRTVGYAPVGPPTTAASRPQFVAGSSGTAATVTVCATYLLFPWVVSTTGSADGRFNFDTGLAINNTTKDPAVIGTTAQAGAVDLYLFASNGTALAPINLSTSLASGGTITTTMSQLKAAGSIAGDAAFTAGYAIVVCGYQLAHGFAFISNQTFPFDFTQGYLALSVTNPRLGAGAVAAFAAGVLESAGH